MLSGCAGFIVELYGGRYGGDIGLFRGQGVLRARAARNLTALVQLRGKFERQVRTLRKSRLSTGVT